MRELQVLLSDDLIYAKNGERIPADETVTIALDGTVRELDLTAGHAKELRDLLAPYLRAGRAPDEPTMGSTGSRHKQAAPKGLIQSRSLLRQVRDFADRNGMRSPDGKRPVYRTETGGYYYSRELMQAWEQHLAEIATRLLQPDFHARVLIGQQHLHTGPQHMADRDLPRVVVA